MKKVYFVSSYDNYPKGIVGESNYQDNIQNALGYIDDDQKRFREEGLTAELFLEDDNPHDPENAVRVEIEGEIVGYLSTSDAKRYRKAIKALELSNIIGVCGAAISGKRPDDYEDMNFGVFLDLDLKDLKVEPERVKPVKVIEEPLTQPPPVVEKVQLKTKVIKPINKIPYIPMNGKGWAYWLIIFPFVAVINLYILLFVGGWYLIKNLFNTIKK